MKNQLKLSAGDLLIEDSYIGYITRISGDIITVLYTEKKSPTCWFDMQYNYDYLHSRIVIERCWRHIPIGTK